MGKLIYGVPGTAIEIEDRTLAHIKVAILAKLRRDEKFAMSWQHGQEGGGGRSTIWLHPSIPLQFVFNGSRQPTLNRAWIEELLATANSASGLQLVPEPVTGGGDHGGEHGGADSGEHDKEHTD